MEAGDADIDPVIPAVGRRFYRLNVRPVAVGLPGDARRQRIVGPAVGTLEDFERLKLFVEAGNVERTDFRIGVTGVFEVRQKGNGERCELLGKWYEKPAAAGVGVPLLATIVQESGQRPWRTIRHRLDFRDSGKRNPALMVIRVGKGGDANLAQVRGAVSRLRGRARRGKNRKQDPDQKPDDADDHQQFDDRESAE